MVTDYKLFTGSVLQIKEGDFPETINMNRYASGLKCRKHT